MKTRIINLNNITIGSDPEFFIVDDKQSPIPSIGLINGTKKNPEDVGNGYAILKDNVLIEGNIPPASTKEEFVSNMKSLKAMMNSLLNIRGLMVFSADSMPFGFNQLEHPEANEFGCSSYKNAWEDGFFAAEDMSLLPIRVAGCHIHIGYEITNPEFSKEFLNTVIARAFDWFVVLPSRMHFNDDFRSRYYGAYGNYRDTPYGLEVRALGGHFGADKYLEWIYEGTMKTMEFCSDPDNIAVLMSIASPKTEDSDFNLSIYEKIGVDINSLLIKEKENVGV